MSDQNGGTNPKSLRDQLNVRPRRGRVDLAPIDPSETNGLKRHKADELTLADEEHIMSLQECLHAEGKRSVLIGAAGHGHERQARHGEACTTRPQPQGVRIVSFKAPTPNELRHDFLWRVRRQLPRPGEIVIFNRSY